MTQQKAIGKGRANKAKYCRDCEEATIHQTGSSLWVSCGLQSGWRSIDSVCNLPITGENNMKLTVYSSKNCPRCRALKKWLRRNNLSFTEKSLDDTDVMTKLVMRNIVVLSAPALEFENRVYLSDQIFLPNNLLNPSFTQILRGEKV